MTTEILQRAKFCRDTRFVKRDDDGNPYCGACGAPIDPNTPEIINMPDKMKTQRDEFDAVDELAKQWRRIQLTPIVDDDYTAVLRHGYESALHALIEKLCDNGRFGENTRGALIMTRHHVSQRVSGPLVFIDSTAAPGGDGSKEKPFQTFTQASEAGALESKDPNSCKLVGPGLTTLAD